jgi:glucose/mannose transport system substrate-binding protein
MKKEIDFEKQIQIFGTIIFIGIVLFGIYSLVFEEADVLVIYHWWTSSGEEAALNSLIEIFSEQYPNVTVVAMPVTGGAGYTMLEIIKPLVTAGKAPDAFQMHAGYEAKPYYNTGLLDSVDDLWESEELEKVVPKVVQVMCQFDGHYYSVPVDIHRANVIWYNRKILDENEINPSTLSTWDDFFGACDKLKSAGVDYPIQMGTDWTAAHVFEMIIASEGIDFYEDWVNGKIISADDERLLDALEIFKKYLSYVNPDNANLEWNDATAKIISGDGAFNIMGDWANGEFKIAGMTYGVEYGSIIVPGTRNMYGLVIDTFQHPRGIVHSENSKRWLKVVSSKEGQDAFNPIKGSISARVDTNLSVYDIYSQLAILDFRHVEYMFPSVVHGSGAPENFRIKFREIIADFVLNKDVNKTAKELTDYTKEISDEYSIIWELN